MVRLLVAAHLAGLVVSVVASPDLHAPVAEVLVLEALVALPRLVADLGGTTRAGRAPAKMRVPPRELVVVPAAEQFDAAGPGPADGVVRAFGGVDVIDVGPVAGKQAAAGGALGPHLDFVLLAVRHEEADFVVERRLVGLGLPGGLTLLPERHGVPLGRRGFVGRGRDDGDQLDLSPGG